MKITVRAIRWDDTVKYEDTYEAKNYGAAYNLFKKDHPDVTNIGEIVKIECERAEI